MTLLTVLITVIDMGKSNKLFERSLTEKISRHIIAVPLVAGIIMTVIAILVWQLVEADQDRRLTAGTQSNAERFASQLEAHIATRLDVADHLSREWSLGLINTQPDFERESENIQKLFGDFQAINWVDNNGIIRWVTPLAGNEAARDLNLRSLKVPSQILAEAERSGRMQVTPPITLAQGGAGFVAYVPLRKNSEKDGTLNIVFRTQFLIEGAFREGTGDDYHLSILDGDTTIFVGEQTEVDDIDVSVTPELRAQKLIKIGNRDWTVSVIPTRQYLDKVASPIDEIVLSIGLMLAIITAYMFHLVLLRQQALRDSEARFRDFANVSSDWFWETDADLRFSFFSEQFEQATGVSPDELLGKTREEIVLTEADPEEWANHIDDLKNQRAFQNYVVPRTHPDGRVVWASVSGKPVYDNAGKFLGYRGTGSNITERKNTELELLRNQHQLKTAVDFAKLGYWEWDEEQDCATYYTDDLIEILDIDPAYFVGGRLDGDKDREHIHPDDLKYYSFISKFSDGQEDRYDIKYRSVRRNGEIRYCREIGEAIRDDSGKIIRSFGTVQDITDLVLKEKALEQALIDAERANQSKSEFLATMSHEFRTPLNAILGFSEMIGAQFFGPLGSEKYEEYLNDIRVSGKHMLALVNDVLDLAAIEAGKQQILIEPISLKKFLKDCNRNLEPAAKAAKISLSLRMPDEDLILHADKRSVYQIMLNLLSNAIKFTEPAGEIIVYAHQEENSIVIEVQDTGVGIPADRLSSVTDPFSQSHADPHRTQEGTGLGLSIVASLVNTLGGSLTIESAVGHGTTVTVSFPVSSG